MELVFLALVYFLYIKTEVFQLGKLLAFQPFCFTNYSDETGRKITIFNPTEKYFIRYFLSITLKILSIFYVKTSQPSLGTKSLFLYQNTCLIACFAELTEASKWRPKTKQGNNLQVRS